MQVVFEYHGITASKRLENFTTEKLQPLFDRYDFVIRADIFFKSENTASHETGMICGIRLSAPGPRLFAESSHKNFEEAIVETVEELRRQLRKRKDKMKTH